MTPEFLIGNITLFMLAIFIGFELITKVPATLHTPLMSGANAISGISIIGALIGSNVAFDNGSTELSGILAFVAVTLAMINVQSTTPSPVSCISKTVVMTATSIPIAPSWFPKGAVRGWPSFLSPKMKRAAEIK